MLALDACALARLPSAVDGIQSVDFSCGDLRVEPPRDAVGEFGDARRMRRQRAGPRCFNTTLGERRMTISAS